MVVRSNQETRRLVAAQLAHITFNEYLPKVVGNDLADKHDLRPRPSGYFNGKCFKDIHFLKVRSPNFRSLFSIAIGNLAIGNPFRVADREPLSAPQFLSHLKVRRLRAGTNNFVTSDQIPSADLDDLFRRIVSRLAIVQNSSLSRLEPFCEACEGKSSTIRS